MRQELKQLMALHGGRFENYLVRGAVTHIVCNHLPDTKIKQLAGARGALPIVRAEWVPASIAAGQLLPVSQAPGPLHIRMHACRGSEQRCMCGCVVDWHCWCAPSPSNSCSMQAACADSSSQSCVRGRPCN